jgi:hypothetical protein
LIGVGWCEHVLMKAADPPTLRRRGFRLLGGGAVLLAAGHLASQLMPWRA